MKPTKYAYSTNEEDYTGEYDTPESAAIDGLEVDGGRLRVYVGECVKPEIHNYIDARLLLENVTENNQEQFGGEWCMPWIEMLFSSKEAIADLDSQLSELLKAWVEKHDLHPTFFNIENVKTYARAEIFPQPQP